MVLNNLYSLQLKFMPHKVTVPCVFFCCYLSASALPEDSPEDRNETIPVNVPRLQGEMVITCSAVFPGRTVTDDGPLKISRSVLTCSKIHYTLNKVIYD